MVVRVADPHTVTVHAGKVNGISEPAASIVPTLLGSGNIAGNR